MKEHPIDDFFKDKLSSLEVEPSKDVWDKIEHHLEDKKKPWGFYLSIAATITVILAIFSYTQLNQNSIEPIPSNIYEEDIPEYRISDQQRPKTTQPGGTVPGSENSIPVMAQEGHKKTAEKHTYLNRKVLALADYNGDESEFSETTLWPIEPLELEEPKENKRKFGISIANSSKYIKNDPEERYRDQLKDYTTAQWDNFTQNRKLDSPPLPGLKLPKIKFDKSRNTAQ